MSGAGSEALFTINLSSSQQCLMPARVLSLAEPSQLISLELFPDWPGAGWTGPCSAWWGDPLGTEHSVVGTRPRSPYQCWGSTFSAPEIQSCCRGLDFSEIWWNSFSVNIRDLLFSLQNQGWIWHWQENSLKSWTLIYSADKPCDAYKKNHGNVEKCMRVFSSRFFGNIMRKLYFFFWQKIRFSRN